MSILQEALQRKKQQELLRRSKHKQKKTLHEINDIFLDAFSLPTPNEEKPILEKLVNIVDMISDDDLDANTKLLEWLEKKFHSKVLVLLH